VSKSNLEADRITILNKKNEKCIKLKFQQYNKNDDIIIKANFEIDSSILTIISGRYYEYYDWISNIEKIDNLSIPKLLDDIYISIIFIIWYFLIQICKISS